ncbi:hypothetical protein L198_03184 [Cryptococcus wingfieldii CBS 7118]|uniref:Zn(2)-C6 fungal-type domain-containing protein n=1 Tax=Cryptococcus wingfieldii CBS 7118 TaxID=1295528 RepID=A0A1E3JEU2_9TREE|nr:hypothetical protein L198_03184 [Cryptococcus wingfieldii CBS 7118]ODN99342.1 hypothetical protein L198_03184 [Cryptococcus wingfieldii CBS 7118]
MSRHQYFHNDTPFGPTGFIPAYSLPYQMNQQPQASASALHHLAPELFQSSPASHTGTSQSQSSSDGPASQGNWGSSWANEQDWATASRSLMAQPGPSEIAPQHLRLVASESNSRGNSRGYADTDLASGNVNESVPQFHLSMPLGGPNLGGLPCGESSTAQYGNRPPNATSSISQLASTLSPLQSEAIKEPPTSTVEVGNKYQQLLASKLLDAPVSLPSQMTAPATFGQFSPPGTFCTGLAIMRAILTDSVPGLSDSNRYEHLVDMKMKSSTMEAARSDSRDMSREMAQFRKSLLEDGCGMMDSGSVPTMARTNTISEKSQHPSYSGGVLPLASSRSETSMLQPLPDVAPRLLDYGNAQPWSFQPIASLDLETHLADYLPQPLHDSQTHATAEILQSYHKAFGFPGGHVESTGPSLAGSRTGEWPMIATSASQTQTVDQSSSSSRSDSFPFSTPKFSVPRSQTKPLHTPEAILPTARPDALASTPGSPNPPLLVIRVHEKKILPPSASDLQDANVTPVIRIIPSRMGPARPSSARKLVQPAYESNMFTEAQVVKKRGRPRKDEVSLQPSFDALAKRKGEEEDGESEEEDSESGDEKGCGKDGKKRKRTRRQTSIACNFCRSKKLKCNGVRPICSVCARRNEGDCVFETALRRRGLAKSRKPSRLRITPLSIDTPLPDFVSGTELSSGVSSARYDFPTPTPAVKGLREGEQDFRRAK